MPKPLAKSTEQSLDESLAKVLDDYVEAQAQGNDPDPQDYIKAHPELAAPLSHCFEALAAVAELNGFLQPETSKSPISPQVLGDYELCEEIGRGGMGVVCKARQRKLGRLVALKMIRAADLVSKTDLQRFRNEAAIVASLDHANIVPIYEVGETPDQLYYSMKLIDGGSLADWIAECRKPKENWSKAEWRHFQRLVVDLMIKVAKAIRHAHQRGILHRDLKPANILLQRKPPTHQQETDAESVLQLAETATPMVTDFGLAKRIESDSELTQSGALLGTPSYMAPEQTGSELGAITTATDVYGLGGVLYALLTGRPPCQGDSLLDTLKKVRESEPASPRSLNGHTDRDLETICLKCLHKQPERRFDSTLRLIQDLERWQSGKPIHARRVSRLERTWRWCRRHPVTAGISVMIAVLLVAGTARALAIAKSRVVRLEEEVLRSNVYAARGMASTILWQMERLSTPVVQAAASRKLRKLVAMRDHKELQLYCESLHSKHADPKLGWLQPGEEPPYASWFVLDAQGRMLAVAPAPGKSKIIGENFSGRDYFRGAVRHAKASGRASVHISRVYHALNLQLHKFAISTPIRASNEADAPIVGVVAVTITTASAFGNRQLNDKRHTVVLVARRDTNQRTGPPAPKSPIEHVILLHPAYKRGDEPLPITSERLQALSQSRPGVEFRLPEARRWSQSTLAMDSDYRDPLRRRDPDFAGRWLAGFAPVGNTEMVVIVQQRYDDVIDSDRELLFDLLLWSGIALLLGLACMGLLMGYGMRNVVRGS